MPSPFGEGFVLSFFIAAVNLAQKEAANQQCQEESVQNGHTQWIDHIQNCFCQKDGCNDDVHSADFFQVSRNMRRLDVFQIPLRIECCLPKERKNTSGVEINAR